MVLGMIGMQEILVIALVILVFFGGRKIPELMKGLGKGVKEYKKAVHSIEEEISLETPVSEQNQEEAVSNEKKTD